MFAPARLIIATLLAALGVAFLLFMLSRFDRAALTKSNGAGLEVVAALVGLSVAVASALITFLQHGTAARLAASAEEVVSSARPSIPRSDELRDLRAGYEGLAGRLNALSSPWTDDQKAELVRLAKQAITGEAIAAQISDLASRMARDMNRGHMLEVLEKNSIVTLARLHGAIPDLLKRANLNLAIGITTTLLGVVVLSLAVFVQAPPAGKAAAVTYVAHFLPRLSLAVIIEVFAYFFLRLYKENLAEVRFLRNEMTNVEVARTALASVTLAGDISSLCSIAQGIATADRNRVVIPDASQSKEVAATAQLLTQLLSAAKIGGK